MKILFVAAIGFVTLGGLVLSHRARCGPARPAATGKAAPLACNLAAFTPQERMHHFAVVSPALLALRKGVRELPDGYEFELPGDRKTFQLASEWVAGEHACCPFFDLQLHLEPEAGPLRLRVTGREGVKRFLEAEGKDWLKP